MTEGCKSTWLYS